jgi:hypothetical protein
MPENSYLEWSEEDIDTLDTLFFHDVPIEKIAKVLGRTPRAIELALKNLLIQQSLHQSTKKVAIKYGMDVDTLYKELVPEKYYRSVPSDGGPCVVVSALVLYILVVVIGMFTVTQNSNNL